MRAVGASQGCPPASVTGQKNAGGAVALGQYTVCSARPLALCCHYAWPYSHTATRTRPHGCMARSHSTHRDLFRAHFESNFGPPDSFGVKLRPSTAHPHSPGPMRSHSDSFRANPRPRRTQLAPSRGNAGQTSTDRDLFRAHFESNFDPSDSFGVILRHTLTNRDVGCSMRRQFGSFCEIVAKPRKGEIPLWARKVTVKSNPPKGYPHFLTRYPPGGQK